MNQQKAATHPFIILLDFFKNSNMHTYGILMARSCASVLKAYLGPIHLQL